MNIENRVTKLEDRIGVNQEPETLEAMIKKFNAGEYKATTMSVVAFILSGGSWDKLKERLPEALVSHFKETMAKIPDIAEQISINGGISYAK
jgi:hypothetical protein